MTVSIEVEEETTGALSVGTMNFDLLGIFAVNISNMVTDTMLDLKRSDSKPSMGFLLSVCHYKLWPSITLNCASLDNWVGNSMHWAERISYFSKIKTTVESSRLWYMSTSVPSSIGVARVWPICAFGQTRRAFDQFTKRAAFGQYALRKTNRWHLHAQ